MIGTDALVAGPALVLVVAAGLVAHEWTHAAVLRLAGVDYAVDYLPHRTDGVIGALASPPWAAVRPRPTGRESPTVFRIAALMPLSLALPIVALGAGGYLPADHAVATATIVGWLGCALPSPQDFSVAFYAHRALESADDAGADGDDDDASRRPPLAGGPGDDRDTAAVHASRAD